MLTMERVQNQGGFVKDFPSEIPVGYVKVDLYETCSETFFRQDEGMGMALMAVIGAL
jgi:hypothetical protein